MQKVYLTAPQNGTLKVVQHMILYNKFNKLKMDYHETIKSCRYYFTIVIWLIASLLSSWYISSLIIVIENIIITERKFLFDVITQIYPCYQFYLPSSEIDWGNEEIDDTKKLFLMCSYNIRLVFSFLSSQEHSNVIYTLLYYLQSKTVHFMRSFFGFAIIFPCAQISTRAKVKK